MKTRLITIHRNELYKDIESLTYKYADVSTAESPKVTDAMSADGSENLDGRILEQSINYRDARLRTKLQFALDDCIPVYTADNSEGVDPDIVYVLRVHKEFHDSVLQALATEIHRYLVCGALYDWYAKGMGLNQAKVYEDELTTLENNISDLLRTPSRAKRPMQPFGPAKRRMPI